MSFRNTATVEIQKGKKIKYCQIFSLIKKKKFLKEEEALGVLKDVLTGFLELIKHGIIHRDLKPANILVSQGIYKLADFGFAKVVEYFKKQMLESIVGTPLYMSPQILAQEKYTSKSDIWSIGFIYYETLYGQRILLKKYITSTMDCSIAKGSFKKYQ